MNFLGYFRGAIPWMIEIAGGLSAALERWKDFGMITTMLQLNAMAGFGQEHKADNAIALLKSKLALTARVGREGSWVDRPAEALVPGNIVRVVLGDIRPTDLQLLAGEFLTVGQAALTGESLPVEKHAGDMAYSGSIAKQGEMISIVTATGMRTLFGRTAGLVVKAGRVSHFQRAVLKTGYFLMLVSLALVTLIFVAAIPVALPAVVSVTMTVVVERLAYALSEFVLVSGAEIVAYRMVDYRAARQTKHLERIERYLRTHG